MVGLLYVLSGASVDALLLAMKPGASRLNLAHGLGDLLAALRRVLPSGLCVPVVPDVPALGAVLVVPVGVQVSLGDAHPSHRCLLGLRDVDVVTFLFSWR